MRLLVNHIQDKSYLNIFHHTYELRFECELSLQVRFGSPKAHDCMPVKHY